MSPLNDNLEPWDDEGDVEDALDHAVLKRSETNASLRGPNQRSKRFKAARRNNVGAGMQRRRNKRISW
jgi:hypothetical protein